MLRAIGREALMGLLVTAAVVQPVEGQECGCSGDEATGTWIEGEMFYWENARDEQGDFEWQMHMLVSRSWGAELPHLVVRMDPLRCGHPVRLNRRVRLEVELATDGEDDAWPVAHTSRCLGFQDLKVEPDAPVPAGDAFDTEWSEPKFQEHVTALARRQSELKPECANLKIEMKPPTAELRPGQWTEVMLEIGGEQTQWWFGQEITLEAGPVAVIGTNPTSCWIDMKPKAESSWLPQRGRTYDLPEFDKARGGPVPPNGKTRTLLLADSEPIRTFRLETRTRAMGSFFPPSSIWPQLRKRLGPSLQAMRTRPAASERVTSDSMLEASLRYRLDELPPEGAFVSLTVERKDRSLVAAPLPGQPLGSGEPQRWWLPTAEGTIDVRYPVVEFLGLEGLRQPLQVRFAIERPTTSSTPDYITAMAPLEFRIDAAAQPAPLPPGGIRYEGGDGTSVEEAVVVLGARSTLQGIRAEHQWLRQQVPGHRFVQQGSIPNYEGRSYDSMTVQVPVAGGGEEWVERTYWFDVTDFFGKPLCCSN